MKKIVIMEMDGGSGRNLAQCLENVFPECEILVVGVAPPEEKAAKTAEPEETEKTEGK
jgi:hypothetical protein